MFSEKAVNRSRTTGTAFAVCCLLCRFPLFGLFQHIESSSSKTHADMLAIHLSVFPMPAEVANKTNIIFQNATLGGEELYPVVLTQPEGKQRNLIC